MKDRYEGKTLVDLVAEAIPEAGAEVHVKNIDIRNSEFPGVSIRAIDRSGNQQYQCNAYKKVGTDVWFCGRVNQNPLPKDAKKLAKSLRDYTLLSESEEVEMEVEAQ